MFEEVSNNLPVVSTARRNYFSLEMTPAGVSLRLDSAAFLLPCGPVGLSGLDLGVPGVTFPFDCQSGPRALRSHLTLLNAVTVEVGFQTIGKICSANPVIGKDPPLVVEGRPDGSLVLAGNTGGKPFSVRVEFSPGQGHRVRVMFRNPRIFGLSDVAWSRIPSAIFAGMEGTLAVDGGEIDVIRPVLKLLLAGLGFKIPLLDGITLASVVVAGESLLFSFSGQLSSSDRFARSGAGFAPPNPPAAVPEPSEMLAKLARAPGDAGAVIEFIEGGVASPVLWPEVLARSLTLGNERPELVSALLAAVLTGAENPGWIGKADFLQTCRRLLTASAAEGCRSEMARCAVLVAAVADRFEPADALDLLNEIRASGFENREVLEAVAITFNRLSRHFDASTTRLRALAMVPAAAAADAVRSMIDRMDANGFGTQASAWLGELGSLGEGGRFGSASSAIHRTSVILTASREAAASGWPAMDGLRGVLLTSPGDPEVLELMLTLAREKHEVAEVVELFRASADRAEGRARCDLLLVAGRAMYEKFGLRRRSAGLLEAALEADPSCLEAAELLDMIYASLGRAADRVELAARRLAGCGDPAGRKAILVSLVSAAIEAGMYDRAASGVKALLRMDPASVDFLRAGEKVFAVSGDQEALREVREALEDLSSAGTGGGLDAALAAGDIPTAVDCISASLEVEDRPSVRLELFLQAADLHLLAGNASAAAPFLAAASAIDPVAAIDAACRACLAAGPDIPGSLPDLLREVARAPMSAVAARSAAGTLLSAAERLAGSSMPAARVLLETAMPLDPDNVSIVMALGAVYEALGMRLEALALLGKV